MDATSPAVSVGNSGHRKPSAWRGSKALDSDSRNSPPPGAAGHRCALITAQGSPTLARRRRMALLAKSARRRALRCATLLQCRGRRCGARGSARTDAPGTASWRPSSCASGSAQPLVSARREQVDVGRRERGTDEEAQMRGLVFPLESRSVPASGRARHGAASASRCQRSSARQSRDIDRIGSSQARRPTQRSGCRRSRRVRAG